jgi:hypothetical protein
VPKIRQVLQVNKLTKATFYHLSIPFTMAGQVDWEEGRISVLPTPLIELAYPFSIAAFKGRSDSPEYLSKHWSTVPRIHMDLFFYVPEAHIMYLIFYLDF